MLARLQQRYGNCLVYYKCLLKIILHSWPCHVSLKTWVNAFNLLMFKQVRKFLTNNLTDINCN